MRLLQGDCLDLMSDIPDGSVDMVMADPPYGTTACKWDSVIPLEPMWEHLKRVIKKNGAIVMTASQPFTTTLISSNMGMFKYELIWDKLQPSNHFLANIGPLKSHENVLIFHDGRATYNPQMTNSLPKNMRDRIKNNKKHVSNTIFGDQLEYTPYDRIENKRFPLSVFYHSAQANDIHYTKRLSSTQKPVALMEYLIKTYTNEGETVLDFCMGSGTTGVACFNLNRRFIGIEKDPEYFRIASERIERENQQLKLFEVA